MNIFNLLIKIFIITCLFSLSCSSFFSFNPAEGSINTEIVAINNMAGEKTEEVSPEEFAINLSHLNSLKETVTAPDGTSLKIWAIYADPDTPGNRLCTYRHVADPDEGLSCVDDVSRAAIVYLKHYEYYKDEESLKMAKEALDFVMYMEEDDGEFYNFVFPDGTVNRDGHTSYKSFGYWAVRGLWSLCEGYRVFKDTDAVYGEKLNEHIKKAISNLDPVNSKSPLNKYGSYTEIKGSSMPAWLVGEGSDQTATAVVALCAYYEVNPGPEIKEIIEKLCEGIVKMGKGSSCDFPFFMHIPYLYAPNQWHAWGSRQMMALATAGRILKRDDFIASAEKEANQWATHLNSSVGMVFGMGPSYILFPHQAYGNEVLAEGFLALYEATGKEVYAKQAGLMASWLTGNNPGKEPVYDYRSGCVFDGVDEDRVSFSSGAESTVCGLMALMDVLENPVAKEYLFYKEVYCNTFQMLEGELGEKFEGKIEMMENRGGEEGLYSKGGYAEMTLHSALSFDFEISQPGEYVPYIIYRAGGKGEIVLSSDNIPDITFQVDGSSGELLEFKTLSSVSFEEGKNKVEVTFRGNDKSKVNLDAIIIQPAVECRVFKNGKGEILTIFKSFLDKEKTVFFSWPLSEDETTLSFSSYTEEGKEKPESSLQISRKNPVINVTLEPYGYTFVEE